MTPSNRCVLSCVLLSDNLIFCSLLDTRKALLIDTLIHQTAITPNVTARKRRFSDSTTSQHKYSMQKWRLSPNYHPLTCFSLPQKRVCVSVYRFHSKFVCIISTQFANSLAVLLLTTFYWFRVLKWELTLSAGAHQFFFLLQTSYGE